MIELPRCFDKKRKRGVGGGGEGKETKKKSGKKRKYVEVNGKRTLVGRTDYFREKCGNVG